MKKSSFAICAIGTALGMPAQAQDIQSFVFNQNISQGTGSINLFRPKDNKLNVSGATLEAFRQDNTDKLVFGVDVNEAASGTETSESMGLAVASAVLTVTINGVEQQFSEFSTLSRSLLAVTGSQERNEYFTMIGNAGSNSISPSGDQDISAMDDILFMPVGVDLSAATAATLDIVLVDTNTDLGDPEAYYDYSNGFEEVALLTKPDADTLEQLRLGREFAPLVITDEPDAPALNWVYYPSAEGQYVASYEDLYPNKGDYDFNDLVVGYQISMGTDNAGAVSIIRGNGYLIARGGFYDHDFHLNLGLPSWASGKTTVSVFEAESHTPMAGYPLNRNFSGAEVLQLFEGVKAIFSDPNFNDGTLDGSATGSTYVNTFPEQNLIRGPKFEFELVLDTPVPKAELMAAPFDPFLFVRDTQFEVHLVGKAPVLSYSNNAREGLTTFRDEAGYPFAMVMVDAWAPPLAAVDMGLAYPEFIEHVRNSGNTNAQWYLNPNSGRIKDVPKPHWKW